MTRLTASIIAAVVLIALLIFGITQCQERQTAGTRAEIANSVGGAAIDAGAEAGNTITAIIANDTATDITVQGGIDEIRNAPAAGRNIAAQCSACRLRARSGDQRCAALRAAGSCEPPLPR